MPDQNARISRESGKYSANGRRDIRQAHTHPPGRVRVRVGYGLAVSAEREPGDSDVRLALRDLLELALDPPLGPRQNLPEAGADGAGITRREERLRLSFDHGPDGDIARLIGQEAQDAGFAVIPRRDMQSRYAAWYAGSPA